jgi:hypothetical protein
MALRLLVKMGMPLTSDVSLWPLTVRCDVGSLHHLDFGYIGLAVKIRRLDLAEERPGKYESGPRNSFCKALEEVRLICVCAIVVQMTLLNRRYYTKVHWLLLHVGYSLTVASRGIVQRHSDCLQPLF